MHSRRGLALAATAALSLSFLATGTSTHAVPAPGPFWERVSTYPVFENLPKGTDPTSETVAEISAVTEDGNTVIHTDSPGSRIGFVDISDPSAPEGAGTMDLGGAEPTSVAVRGDFALVVVSTGDSYTEPSGELRVVRISDRTVVRTFDLGGQPDSIALAENGNHGAIAIENERDEEHNDGALPQAPAGFVQLLDLPGDDPAAWSTRTVPLTGADGSALPALAEAGMHAPTDPEPEYVDINSDGVLALSLQENNGIVTIDVATGEITGAFSAGEATVTDVDNADDGRFNRDGTVSAPREPDSIAWIGTDRLATANEGDLKGGTRGWSVFDTDTGEVVWDAGNGFEQLAERVGLHNDGRADNKGVEPEGLAVATVGGVTRAFVGSERSNFVGVYDVTVPQQPRLEQVLPTTMGPEGLLPVPERDLFVVSSEEDSAADGVRSTVAVHQLGAEAPAFPAIESADDASGAPIGWGALGALAAEPGDPGTIWAASDSAYAAGRIYRTDVSGTPARITEAMPVREADGSLAEVDIEGLHADEDGFWVASEGSTGPENQLLRLERDGTVVSRVGLPQQVADHVGKWGFEGVTVTRRGAQQVVHVALQRPLLDDPADPAAGYVDGEQVARIGSYYPDRDQWRWHTYPLAATDAGGDWVGLSEVTAVDRDTLAVVERDKQAGTTARIKQVHTVDLTSAGGTFDNPQRLDKELAVDVLPELESVNGWTPEKLEGLTVAAGGEVYAVTDNDALDDASGETRFLRLGTAGELFGN